MIKAAAAALGAGERMEEAGRPRTLLTPTDAHGAKLVGAFFLIYFVWGSNFLAIRYAVETLPPFLLMGVRSLLAGLCLYVWARLRGAEGAGGAHWRSAAGVGILLFLGCHGSLAWAQQHVPSGIAALGLATIPFWMTLLDWLWAGASRPSRAVWLGLALPSHRGHADWSSGASIMHGQVGPSYMKEVLETNAPTQRPSRRGAVRSSAPARA